LLPRVADLALLERTLRERLPGATGATGAEIAAAEARLGVALPDELKVLYRVTRAPRADGGDDHAAAEHAYETVGCDLFPLDELNIAAASTRPCPWQFTATEAVITPPEAAVQGLVGSPGWIAFGDNEAGDRFVPRYARQPPEDRQADRTGIPGARTGGMAGPPQRQSRPEQPVGRPHRGPRQSAPASDRGHR
jgi:hypothetical protein